MSVLVYLHACMDTCVSLYRCMYLLAQIGICVFPCKVAVCVSACTHVRIMVDSLCDLGPK